MLTVAMLTHSKMATSSTSRLTHLELLISPPLCVCVCVCSEPDPVPVCQACRVKTDGSGGRGRGKSVRFGGVTEMGSPIDAPESGLLGRLLSRATVAMPTIGLGSLLSEREGRYLHGRLHWFWLWPMIVSLQCLVSKIYLACRGCNNLNFSCLVSALIWEKHDMSLIFTADMMRTSYHSHGQQI